MIRPQLKPHCSAVARLKRLFSPVYRGTATEPVEKGVADDLAPDGHVPSHLPHFHSRDTTSSKRDWDRGFITIFLTVSKKYQVNIRHMRWGESAGVVGIER